MVVKECGIDSRLLDLSDGEKELVEELSKKLGLHSLIRIANALGRVDKEIGLHINNRLILEAALINCILMMKQNGESTTK